MSFPKCLHIFLHGALWLHRPLELVSKYQSTVLTLLGEQSCRLGRREEGGISGWGEDPKAAGSTPAAVATLFPVFAGSVLDPLITYLSTVESNGLHQEKKT